MISLKELKYVNTNAVMAPYPGDAYATETLEGMKEMFEKYHKNYYGKNYSIIFSDATELSFEILDFNICHMFGIDFKSLVSVNNLGGPNLYQDFLTQVLGFSPSEVRITSYELTKAIIDNYEEVVKYDSQAENRALNYYKSRIKSAIFEKMSEFEKFNFGKLYTHDDTLLLYTPSNEAVCPYFFVRLSKDQNKDYYGISSLMAPEKDKIDPYFGYGAAIPTQMIIDDNKNLNKIIATPKEKIEMLKSYKNIITTYNLDDKMDVSGDYLAVLSEADVKQKILNK